MFLEDVYQVELVHRLTTLTDEVGCWTGLVVDVVSAAQFEIATATRFGWDS